MQQKRDDIIEAVRRLLAQQAQHNEYRVAIIRVLSYSLVTCVDVLFYVAGLRPLANVLVPSVLIAIALGLVALVRRFHRPWFGYAIPVLDAIFLVEMLTSRISQTGLTASLIATTALACGLFAVTGGIRFDRWMTAWTTFLALLVLWILVGSRAEAGGMLYAVVALCSIGLLTMWLADMVRRSVEGARGRLVLERFLQRGVVDRAFTDPEALVMEPKTVEATVLISDLRGFTAIAERMEPASVLELLNEVQGALAAAVERHGGVVDKFMGDGMLAVFGAPEESKDHALRALRAAADIRIAVEHLNARRTQWPRLDIGVGIHSGPLIAGVVGDGRRLEFTVLGDTVNIAARLESMTKEKQVDVLLSAATVAGAAQTPVIPLGEALLRGRAQPIAIYALG